MDEGSQLGNLLEENAERCSTVIVRAVLDIATLTWDEVERVPYDGEWALCDRAATNEAKNAENQAANTSYQEQSNAAADRSTLMPFYRQEMNAQHLYNPAQTNEMLNFAGAGTGGAGSAAAGEAASTAARTRNTSGFAPALDQNARDRASIMSRANLGVGAQDVEGAKMLNQQGAQGMAGLEGLDTKAMLESMGQEAPDINAQVNAGQHGWFQNMQDMIRSLGTAAGGFGKAAQSAQDANG